MKIFLKEMQAYKVVGIGQLFMKEIIYTAKL